jgi:P pilus assembly chaperone PapD
MSSKKLKKSSCFIRSTFLFVILFSCFTGIYGQGDLLVTPRRVIFEGNKRSVDLNLANTGNDTATYSISLVQIRMTENGGFETITEPDSGQLFADRNIRYFPRMVTLGPNEAQLVKVQLVRSEALSPGEYRSHFYFRAVPKPKPLGEKEKVKDTTSISVVLTPVFGITIPVIIKVGESTATVKLSDLAFSFVNDTIPYFSMIFNRQGNMSVYGDIAIYYISDKGKETKVGMANGLAIYTPNKIRKFRLELSNDPGINYHSGTLKVVFSASTDVKPVRYAEAEVQLH